MSQVECVESLSVQTLSGVSQIQNPGAPSDGDQPASPYVSVMKPSDQMPTLNYSIVNPADPVSGPGSYAGLEDGTYSFAIRLGSLDPSFTGISGDPVSVVTSLRSDGSFLLSVTAKPKPFISVMSSVQSCISSNWSCDGEVGVQRNISGFVVTHPTEQLRSKIRGSWVATNASSFSTPQFSISERKVAAAAAGPHTVPAGYPLDGLAIESGKGLNPAFYKAFVPYSVLELMLELAPADLKSYLTPETVKAKISEAGSQKDQSVSVTSTELGVVVDLGLTHFSAPNPEITFQKKETVSPPAIQPAAPDLNKKAASVSPGKKFSPSSFIKVPSGYKISSVKVRISSSKVCSVSGSKILAKKPGKCSYSVVLRRGRSTKAVSASVTVSK